MLNHPSYVCEQQELLPKIDLQGYPAKLVKLRRVKILQHEILSRDCTTSLIRRNGSPFPAGVNPYLR